MNKRIAVALVVLIVTAGAAIADVRGKVVYPDGVTPYEKVAATLVSDSAGRSGTVYSGNDGMFYLQNVPPGNYKLELKSARETKTFAISVKAQPVTDVAPVRMQ